VDQRKVTGANLEHTIESKILSKDMSNTIGVQFRQDDIKQVGLFRIANRVRNIAIGEGGTLSSGSVKDKSYSIFARNTTEWTPLFRTFTGVRGDYFDFDVCSTLPENSGRSKSYLWSPKFSAIFQPWNKTEFCQNIGPGFHSNNARGTTNTVNPFARLPVDRVDPLVRTRGSEIGVHTEGSNWKSAFALWRLDVDSELLFVGDVGTTEASRPSRREGIEFANYFTPMEGVIVVADIAIYVQQREVRREHAGGSESGLQNSTNTCAPVPMY
jgi:hypothetical protein